MSDANAAAFQTPTPGTETQRVFEILKQRILKQEFAAGMPLSHSQLCRDLSTSRTPVREALSKLEGLGLVTTVPHRGAFVARVDLQDFLEITQIRALLEPFAARQCAGRVMPATLEALEQRLCSLNRDHPSEADFDALHEIDAEIHRLIGRSAGNRRLDALTENLRGLCEQFSFDSRVRFDTMIDELLALLAALRIGDGAAAEQIMQQHIHNFGEALPMLSKANR